MRVLTAGTYRFDQIEIGDRIEAGSVVVSVDMIDGFAELSGDRFAIHMDKEAAQSLGFEDRVAHGLLVLSLVDGLKNQAEAQLAAVASLGWDWKFERPVLVGDDILVEITVTGKRETKRAERGIAMLAFEVRNQRGEIVQSGQNKLMMVRG